MNQADTTTQQPRAIAYLRVSTTEQGASGLGLQAQSQALEAYCESRGIELLEIVTEVASGKTTAGRPLLAATLNRLDAGEADRLIVAKVDRLARNLLDLLTIAQRGERKGWGIVTLDLDLDTSTPNGRFTLQMIGSVAELERQMIGDRTRVALAAARERGTVLGRPRIVAEATYVQAKALQDSGLSLAQIARELTAEGHARANGSTEWTRSAVHALLRSPYGAQRPESIGV
jgi:DNA invertase Pin-like site-specific DNA recombinase